MIRAEDLDRIRAALMSVEGVRGFAATLRMDGGRVEVVYVGIDPDAAAQAIANTAIEYRKALAEDPPLRLN